MCNESKQWNLYWWELPPFVERVNGSIHDHAFLKRNGTDNYDVQGLMLEMLSKSMEICCLKHTGHSETSDFSSRLIGARQFENQEQLLNNLTDMNTVAMPIMLPTAVAASNPTAMFIRMIDNTGMMYIARHRDQDEVGNVVLEGFLNIWPLFMAVIVLTGYMAIFLWLAHLRQYMQANDRPVLVQNYFEWYWCAFITAATIGYGDRVPKNVIGKLLMMAWALAGLSVMSVFVATMTTMLTEHKSIMSSSSDMKDNKVGVLAGSVERRFVLQDGGKPVEYHSISSLVQALNKGDVDGIAVDHYSFHHLYSTNELDGLDYEVASTPGITVGFILFGEEQHDLLSCLKLQAFLNELNVDSTIMRTFSHSYTNRELKDEASVALQSTALTIVSNKMRLQLLVLGGILMMLVMILAIVDYSRNHGSKAVKASKVLDGSQARCLEVKSAKLTCGKQSVTTDVMENLDVMISRSAPMERTPQDGSALPKAVLCARCASLS